MHGNAPPHTNKTTHQFLEREEVNTMQWPAISPVMNPIEYVWAHLKQKMRKIEHCHNADDLFETLSLIWNQVTPEFIFSLTTINVKTLNALSHANGRGGACLVVDALHFLFIH